LPASSNNLNLDLGLFEPEKAIDHDATLMEAATTASVVAADKMVSIYDESHTQCNSKDNSTSTDDDYEVDNEDSDPNWSPSPSPQSAIKKVVVRTRKM